MYELLKYEVPYDEAIKKNIPIIVGSQIEPAPQNWVFAPENVKKEKFMQVNWNIMRIQYTILQSAVPRPVY